MTRRFWLACLLLDVHRFTDGRGFYLNDLAKWLPAGKLMRVVNVIAGGSIPDEGPRGIQS
jgi:hypothetical protein